MRIFITGISGFVARHFVDLLGTMNEKFVVLGIYNSTYPNFSENEYDNVSCEFLQLNLLNKEVLKETLKNFNPDYILHLASKSSVAYSWQKPGELVLENSKIFINLVEILRELNSDCRMLSVGSAEEYGIVDGESLPLKETYRTNPVSPYGAARVLQNNLVNIYSKNYGLNLIHTRSFNHIGPYQNENFVIGSFVKQISSQLNEGRKSINLIVGDIEVVRDFTDVRDVVKAYFTILKNGKKGETYNVCSGKGYKLSSLIDLFAKITHTSITTQTNKNNFRPSENKEIIGSYEKLQKATGWHPTISIQQTLEDLLDYWKEKVEMIR